VQPFAFHSAATPLIRVNGDYAEGEWHLIALHNGRAFWSTGIYEDKFKRTAEGWRLAQVYTRLREAQQQGGSAGRPSGWPDLFKEAGSAQQAAGA
jgi:hypothetical protein